MNGIDQPLRIPLYPHQLESVTRMENLEQNKFVHISGCLTLQTNLGINCNISGSGKTLSMVALIQRNRMEWDLNKPLVVQSIDSFCDDNLSTILTQNYQKNNISLIICNPWLVNHWEKELSYSDLKYITITKNKSISLINNKIEVIIVVPSMMIKVCQHYYRIAWKRIIFDEPTSLKIPSVQFRAGFMWFITSNPQAISNERHNNKGSSLDQILWSARLNIYNKYLQIKQSADEVKIMTDLPKPDSIVYNCIGHFKSNKGIVSEYVLSLIEQNDIERAIKLLGGNKSDDILTTIKNKKEIQLRELKSRLLVAELQDRADRVSQYNLDINNKVRELEYLQEKITSRLSEPCVICHDTIKNPILELNCCNIFCGQCALKWFCSEKYCPLCKVKINYSHLYHFNTIELEQKCDVIPNKDDVLIKILKQENKKFIVFCLDEHSDYVKSLIQNNQICVIELAGKADSYSGKLNTCRQGKAVLLLNSKTNYIGINLEWSTDIIFYDYSIKQSDIDYLIKRVNRFGQQNKITIHNLVSVE